MALEDLTGTKYINALTSANPLAGDSVSDGAGHLRGLKNVLKLSFPGVDGAVNSTDTELNENDRSAQAVTNHSVALRTYFYSAATIPTGIDIDSVIAEDAWETVGATGSGADNIWTDLDNVGSDAKAVIIRFAVSVTSTAAGALSLYIYARPGNTTWAFTGGSRVAVAQGDVAGASDTVFTTTTAVIPVDSSDRTFDLYWEGSNNASQILNAYYVGYFA